MLVRAFIEKGDIEIDSLAGKTPAIIQRLERRLAFRPTMQRSFLELRRRKVKVEGDSADDNPDIEDGASVRSDFLTRRGVLMPASIGEPFERQMKGLQRRRNQGFGRHRVDRRQPNRIAGRKVEAAPAINVREWQAAKSAYRRREIKVAPAQNFMWGGGRHRTSPHRTAPHRTAPAGTSPPPHGQVLSDAVASGNVGDLLAPLPGEVDEVHVIGSYSLGRANRQDCFAQPPALPN